MEACDTLIRNACVIDGSGSEGEILDVAIAGDRIVGIGSSIRLCARSTVDADGLVLAPGFVDVHTHDDIAVLKTPQMLPKLSQGVTTVIVGNCGISAAPVELGGTFPDPMNLLGEANDFKYPTFAAYIAAIDSSDPAVNVAALVGHTSLRNNHLDRLDRSATEIEISLMRTQLIKALEAGALGLSTGLAYLSANAADTKEILGLTEPLAVASAVYTSHMRTESDTILEAMDEAFRIGRLNSVPVILSHLKCAGIDNWGRSREVLSYLESARLSQQIGCDCYPYAAGSSTLDLRQVDERIRIMITWSIPHPEMAGKTISEIASAWATSQLLAAKRLQPAGAIYHSISEDDMRRILQHPATMIGSDGLPNDPRPHPRLWGTFPRVLGTYCRELKMFSLPQAIYKMTALPAARFGLAGRGLVRDGFYADLVLFDPETVSDKATFENPIQPAQGIHGVWVNGVLSYTVCGASQSRAGRFLPRSKTEWIQ